MNMEPNVSARSPEIEPKENILLGVLGAILFSLAGVVIYFLLNQAGYIASISAAFGAYAALFGYGLFARKKDSKAGIITSAVVTVVMMILSIYLCYVYELYSEVRDTGVAVSLGRIAGDLLKTLFGSGKLCYGINEWTIDMSVLLKDLLMTLLFTALGLWGFVQTQRQKKKAAAAAAQQPTNKFPGSDLPTDSTSANSDETK